jgi:hypothetical protein
MDSAYWTFEVIQPASRGQNEVVVEEDGIAASAVSLEEAARMFRARYDNLGYLISRGCRNPGAIRFLDEHGLERLRYTAEDHHRGALDG